MTNGLTSPKAAQGPASPAPEAARGAPPPNDAFAGILGDAQQARTATAEGQSPEKPTTGDDCTKPAEKPTPDPASTGTPAPDATATTAAAAVLVALPVPVQAPAAAAAPAAAPAAPVTAAVEQSGPVAQVGAPAAEPATAMPVAAGTPVETSVAVPVAPREVLVPGLTMANLNRPVPAKFVPFAWTRPW